MEALLLHWQETYVSTSLATTATTQTPLLQHRLQVLQQLTPAKCGSNHCAGMQTLNSNTEWHFVHFLSICEILNCLTFLSCVFSNTNNSNTGWHLLQTLRFSIPSALVRQRQSGCLFTSIDMTIESAKEKEASRQLFPVDLVCSNQSSAKFEESWDRTWKKPDQLFLLHTFHYTWAQKCLLRKV